MSDDEFTTRDWVVLAGLIVMVLGGFSTMIGLGYFASNSSPGALLAAIISGGATVTAGVATAFYAASSRSAEDKILTFRQRRDLRRERGKVVMEKALIEVEHERDNIVHNRMLEAADPDVPPHQTRWSAEEARRGLE